MLGINIVFIFIFGAAVGSFLNVLILRLPHAKKINGRSGCPHCGYQLAVRDLVPIASFIALLGKCRQCRVPISRRYPIIESLTAALFALVYILVQPIVGFEGFLFLLLMLFITAVLVVVFVIDYEHYLILDKVVFFASGVVFAVLVALGFLQFGFSLDLAKIVLQILVGAIVGALPLLLLWFVSKGKWMGFGDVKFAGFMGLVLGSPVVFVALFLAFILGSLAAIPLLLFGSKDLQSKVPFGMFLTVATFIALFFGQDLWQGYLKLIGW